MIPRIPRFLIVIAAVSGILCAQTLRDPSPRRGIQPSGSYLLGDIETISETNGNLMLRLPLASLPPTPQGPGFGVSLVYNSKIWEPATTDAMSGGNSGYSGHGLSPVVDPGGWRYGVNYELEWTSRTDPNPDCSHQIYSKKLRVAFPDGSRHVLHPRGLSDMYGDGFYSVRSDGSIGPLSVECGAIDGLTQTMVYFTNDGTYARLEVLHDSDTTVDNNPWTLYLADGTRVEGGNAPDGSDRPQRVCDRNENCVSIQNYAPAYRRNVSTGGSSTITDERSICGSTPCSITITYGKFTEQTPAALDDTISGPGFNGTELVWTAHWAYSVIPAASLYGWIDCETFENGQGICPVSSYQQFTVGSLSLPSQANVGPYSFAYNATWGELSQVQLPSGATAQYQYAADESNSCDSGTLYPKVDNVLINYPCRKIVTYKDRFADGSEPDVSDTFQYQHFTDSQTPPMYYVKATAPDGGVTETHYFPQYWGYRTGLVRWTKYPDGSIVYKHWDVSNHYNFVSGEDGNTYQDFEVRKVTVGGQAYGSLRTFTVDRNGNVLSTKDYDWRPWSCFTLDPDPVEPTVSVPNGQMTELPLVRYAQNTFYNPTSQASQNPAGDEAAVYWNTGAPRLPRLALSNKVSGPGNALASHDEYCYDAGGNVTYYARSTDGAGAALISSCQTGAHVANALVSSFTYGPHGTLTQATDPRGIATTNSYDVDTCGGAYPTGKTEGSGTPQARHWTYIPDCWTGKVTSTTDVDNSVTTTANYDAFGRVTSTTDPAKTVSVGYDDNNRLKQTTTNEGARSNVIVEKYNELWDTSVVERQDVPFLASDNSVTHASVYTEAHTRYVGGYKFAFESTPFRLTAGPGDPPKTWKRSKFDTMGRLIGSAYIDGASLPSPLNIVAAGGTVEYDGFSRTETDEGGKSRTLVADPLGRLTSVTDGAGTATYTYDGTGNLTHVYQGQQGRSFQYDFLGRLTSATNPESGTTTYAYDGSGNLVRKIASNGVVTCFWPSSMGVCSASTLITTGYDALQRPLGKQYSDGTPEVAYAYDASPSIPNAPQESRYHGRLTTVSNSNSATDYQYDALGRVVASQQRLGTNAYPFYYTYNGLTMASETYPSGRTVNYGYDSAGRPNAVTGYVSAVGYHPHGTAYLTVLGNLVEEKALYNGRLQPYALEAIKGSSLWKLENFYCPDQQSSCGSNNGNVMSQRLTAPKRQDAGGGLLTLATAYDYDAANRLTSATETGGGTDWNQGFTYDQFGNQQMTQTPLNVSPIDLHCPSYDGTNNRCTGGFQYDNGVSGGPGNITAFPGDRTAAYDAENRQTTLTEITLGNTSTWQYLYDGEGRRVKKVGGTRTVVYVYDGMGQLAAEYDSAPPEPAPCATCYLTVDHLGSTRLMTDASGTPQRRYDYLPFGWDIQSGYGNRSAVAGYVVADKTNPKFTSKERDYETGLELDYFGARYLSAAQGRWTTPDWSAKPVPVPYADLSDPQTLNLYVYVRGNPLRLGDPDGHGFWDWVWTVRSGGKKIPRPPKPLPPPASTNPVYPTSRDAAIAAANMNQQKQKQTGAEHASSVYNIGPAYTYTDAVTQGMVRTVDNNNPTRYFSPRTYPLDKPPIPAGTQLVAETHSHPDNKGFSSDDTDRSYLLTLRVAGHPLFGGTYVGQPNGVVIMWDPFQHQRFDFITGGRR